MEKNKLIELVTKSQNGDMSAMNELFTCYYNDVYYFALKTIKDSDIACDITQETFLEITLTIGNLKAPEAFFTWMRTIAYHQCTRYFKKKKDILVDEDEDGNSILNNLVDESEDSLPSAVYEKEEFRKTILGMIDELSEEQRSAVMLFYFDELSVKEIAEIQDVSEGTVKSRLNYARKAIKKSVEDYEEKHGIKLHSIALLPLLRMFFDGKGVMPEAKSIAVGKNVMAAVANKAAPAVAVGTCGQIAAAPATAAQTASNVSVGTGFFAKLAKLPLVTKIIAGVISAAIVSLGAFTWASLNNNNNQTSSDDNDPTNNTMQIIENETSKGETNGEITNGGHIHSWSVWNTLISPTCTAEGQDERTCSCGEKETQTIAALAHTEVVTPGQTATCMQTGLSEGKYCSACSTVIEEQTTLPVTDHNYSYGKCTVCGMFEKASIGLAFSLSPDGKSYYVSGIGTCEDSELFIPSMYNGLPVTAIGEFAFYQNKNLTEVAIPDTVMNIDYGAFSECNGLTSVMIGNGVTSIADGVFYNCTSLVYNEYDNAYYLGNSANPYVVLIRAKSTDIELCEINEKTKIIYRSAFANCVSLTSIAIPGSVMIIDDNAFYCCKGLTSLTMGNGVVSIGTYAFYDCRGLTSVTIGNNVTSIGDYAFQLCWNIKSVTIDVSLKSIGKFAFQCMDLSNITYNGTMEQWAAIEKGTSWDFGTWFLKIHCTDGTVS